MNDKYQQFFNLYNGKAVEREDASNYAQCFDLAFAWVDLLGIPRDSIRHLLAREIWEKPTDQTRKYFDLIANSATNIPQVGDIVVFGTKVGTAGHVSIATPNSNSVNLVSFDQNWGGAKYARIITHTAYNGVLGWLHPKSLSVNWDDKVNQMKNALNAGGTSEDRAKNADKIFHS